MLYTLQIHLVEPSIFKSKKILYMIHDTFVRKTTANMTFMPFLCCDLITIQDRPYKIYISLKLRAFYTLLIEQAIENGTWTILYGVYLI